MERLSCRGQNLDLELHLHAGIPIARRGGVDAVGADAGVVVFIEDIVHAGDEAHGVFVDLGFDGEVPDIVGGDETARGVVVGGVGGAHEVAHEGGFDAVAPVVGEVEIGRHVRQESEELVAEGVPEIQHAVLVRANEAGAEDGVRLPA